MDGQRIQVALPVAEELLLFLMASRKRESQFSSWVRSLVGDHALVDDFISRCRSTALFVLLGYLKKRKDMEGTRDLGEGPKINMIKLYWL